MATRYRPVSAAAPWFQGLGVRVEADAAGWLTPPNATIEAAMREAGCKAENEISAPLNPSTGQKELSTTDKAVMVNSGYPKACIFNYDPLNYKRARKALAAARVGTGNMRVVCVGNSTEHAVFTGGGQYYSPSARLKEYLKKRGYTANNNSFFGQNPTSTANWDNRISVGAGWSSAPYFGVGRSFLQNGSNTNPIQFTPDTAVDRYEIDYWDADNTNDLTYQIGAAAAVPMTKTGTSLVKTLLVSAGSATTSAFKIYRSAGYLHIAGFRCYNSASPEIMVMNGGSSGSLAADWVGESGTRMGSAHLKVVAPDLTFIKGSINDWGGQGTFTDLTAFKASLQTLVTAALVSGDVVICTDAPSQINGAYSIPLATQATYVQAMIQVATANNLAYIDRFSALQSFELQGGTTSGYYTDALHGGNWQYDEEGSTRAKFFDLLGAS